MRSNLTENRGFTLIEIMMALSVLCLLFALGMPMLTTALDNFRLSGDGRTIANAVAVAKMRAAATFTRGRLFVDLNGKSFIVQRYDKTSSTWVNDGPLIHIANRDSFGYGAVGSPPSNTQPSIGQAPACKDNSNNDISNSACVVFNSRGIPVDTSGAPIGTNALYLTDGITVYGVTVAATGLARTWRTTATATPNWVLQ
jgi:prepilin-type N-terminal cleavage/methylation domain-containing protein